MKRICQGCQAEIVYGFAASADGKEQKFLCDECANVWSMEYGEAPAFFPVRQPGHC